MEFLSFLRILLPDTKEKTIYIKNYNKYKYQLVKSKNIFDKVVRIIHSYM